MLKNWSQSLLKWFSSKRNTERKVGSRVMKEDFSAHLEVMKMELTEGNNGDDRASFQEGLEDAEGMGGRGGDLRTGNDVEEPLTAMPKGSVTDST